MTFAWKLVSTVCCQWIAFIVTYISQSDAGGEMKSGGKQKQVRLPTLGLLAMVISTHHNAPTVEAQIAPTWTEVLTNNSPIT